MVHTLVDNFKFYRSRIRVRQPIRSATSHNRRLERRIRSFLYGKKKTTTKTFVKEGNERKWRKAQ